MKNTVSSSLYAFRQFQPIMDHRIEEVWVMALSSTKQPLKMARLFRGTVDACLFHPRDVFRFVLLQNASGFILAHNHPSGDPTPSHQDIKITKELVKASQFLQIDFYDHLIITKSSYVSLLDIGFSFQSSELL